MLKKYTYEYVKDAIEREEYKLLSTKYINSSIKLNVLCPKNHKYKVKYNVFQQGKRCPVCAGTQRHTYKYIKEQIEFDGYKRWASGCDLDGVRDLAFDKMHITEGNNAQNNRQSEKDNH